MTITARSGLLLAFVAVALGSELRLEGQGRGVPGGLTLFSETKAHSAHG